MSSSENKKKHTVYRVYLSNGVTRIIDFYREESSAFQYGNQTSVVIEFNEQPFEVIDTRYNNEVIKNFPKWCEKWIKNYFRKDLNPVWNRLL